VPGSWPRWRPDHKLAEVSTAAAPEPPSGPGRTWRSLYQQAAARLGDHQVARWFVEEASGGRWPMVLDEEATAGGAERLGRMVERRCSGEPVQYVLGHWAFRGLDLLVDRRALIPRPETEVVVEVALGELDRLGSEGALAVDLGTGSGAIALSLAAERPGVQVWATDRSEGALAVAAANLAGGGARVAGRVSLARGDWWEALPEDLAGRVTLAVANPPYIAEAELAGLPEEVVAWEPREALVAGPTGLEALEQVLGGAARWLAPRSALVAEIAPHQPGAAQALACRAGFDEAFVRPDLTGRDRVLVARRSPGQPERPGAPPAVPAR